MNEVNEPKAQLEAVPSTAGLCHMSQQYACIVADPPWRIDLNRSKPHPAKGSSFGGYVPQLVYPTLSDEEIIATRPPIAGAAHLYIWTVNAKIETAYRMARAWGFRPASLLVWAKTPMGVGLGGTFCNTTEFCLFARKGTHKAMRRVPSTWWNWKRGKHSVKPSAFYEMVEAVSPGPRLEMYARKPREGWHVWGNEVPCDIFMGHNVVSTPD